VNIIVEAVMVLAEAMRVLAEAVRVGQIFLVWLKVHDQGERVCVVSIDRPINPLHFRRLKKIY
jgi:hypothetical protein